MWNTVEKLRDGNTHKGQGYAQAGVRCFSRSRRGNTTVEYALFLTLVAACGIGAAQTLGVVTEVAFQRLVLEPSGVATNSSESTPMAIDSLSTVPETPPSDTSAFGKTSLEIYQLAIGAIGIAIGWLVWYRLHDRRKLIKPAASIDDSCEELEAEDLSKRIFEKRQAILNILSGDWTGATRGEIEVGTLMSRNVCTAEPDATRSEVEALIDRQSLRHLIVVDSEGAVLGVISDRDLQKRDGKFASRMMTPVPFTVTPKTSITPAVTLLVTRRISCLPVVENGQLRGVLTTTDLIMALQCILQIFVKQSLDERSSTGNEILDANRLSQELDDAEMNSADS